MTIFKNHNFRLRERERASEWKIEWNDKGHSASDGDAHIDFLLNISPRGKFALMNFQAPQQRLRE